MPGADRVLSAGLVQVRVDAQRRLYRLQPEPLRELADWRQPYRTMWADRLDQLEAHLSAHPDVNEPAGDTTR